MRKITKADLVDAVYEETVVERKTVQQVVEQFIDAIKKSLEAGATIELRGFGTFEPRLRKGRKRARNPRTGESLSVEPHYIAAFRPGQELKQTLWNLSPET